ncbi:sugar ABC transporter permease [Terrabacter sp. MAHUQ-38]|uniref:ABC transporter permease n=1 Tax=unclassified Terrabacter TaxID=2630222 RepID=UPI00165E94FB|nr:ABC transporter permease subunit [Terrabacter sp. MAHUQ-38]MBC9820492.1 sugar ABC transporter permease [Terrabacter sp. MAHUQ-38]
MTTLTLRRPKPEAPDARPRHPQPTPGPSLAKRMALRWQLYVLIAPALLYIVVFKFWPMYGVQIAFRNFNPFDGFGGSPWAGLQHFQRFFGSAQFATLLENTIGLAVTNLVVAFPVPIILALMLNQLPAGRLRSVVQGILYSPTFISTVVVVGMLYLLLSPRTGMVNNAIDLLGGERILFMGSPEWFRPVFVGTTVWQESGFQMVIYLAALASIDPALHDAARVDGANTWQRLRHVDLPGIAPTIAVLFLLAVGNLMNVSFEKALLMQTPLNLESSQIIQTYVYQAGLQQAQFSYSAAIGLFNSLLNLVLLLTFARLVSRLQGGADQ